MLKKSSSLIVFLFVIALVSSCSDYNKLLKSTNYEQKYEAAIKYYEEGSYFKAYPLLEELVSLYRGTEKAEKIYFYYAYCNYYLDDYELAGYHFKNFVKTYPTSKYALEALYMNALTYYMNSSDPSLDQTNTYKAITELQYFINKYPGSEKATEAAKYIEELRDKLEIKAFNICKQYYRTENYKSAIVCVENSIKEFPSSKFNEELEFISLKSSYIYAINSIEAKKGLRLQTTIELYNNFIDHYPQGAFTKEAKTIHEFTTKAINKQS
ncbi:MAG: outer membrane protein assembly factor BamD [Bacteroidetes bacterium]|nr:outer membrane protein assembly factor BamD [Bacteroidota bacterium]HET6244076.1 outer membrane protein assembly factor BamD [Bacteroidia bacterium]